MSANLCLKFNYGSIQIYIAMSENKDVNFNAIMHKLIKKSLFTERQIEILGNIKGITKTEFHITRGAYYRQVAQVRTKLASLYYTQALLMSLGVIKSSDIDVIIKLSKQIDVLKNSDIFPEKEEDVMRVVDLIVKQACNT
ncbi:MAG: hypothetical protein K8823_219 [Cenarchaeum symbiont of Oopsacas minuta]|nr:hypothetical protein [Cenarchaeum symbiont of Oopsacas minuta]